ncbi:MAG: hypothetical protein LBO66_12980, partial [Deltaproteobacteria bacterium]|nr:hypothetical protein [Deltaproteobacteria bacterium]
MNQNAYLVADYLVDGKISLLQKEKETLASKNETLASENETLASENEGMRRTIDVLAQRAGDKSVEEISEILKISASEVNQ